MKRKREWNLREREEEKKWEERSIESSGEGESSTSRTFGRREILA